MAKKPTLLTVGSGYNSSTAINTSFERLRDAFDNTLSLDGSTPNAMEADLDLNGNDIINVGTLYVDTVLADDFTINGGTEGFLASVEAAADRAEAAAAATDASVFSTFNSRSGAIAATIDPAIDYIRLIHDGVVLDYVRDASGTALTTNAGAVTWSPATPACSPAHWGATASTASNQATAIQACFDFVEASFSSTYGTYSRYFTGLNKTYYITASLDFGAVRSGGLLVRDVIFFGSGSFIMMDMTHSNRMTFIKVACIGSESSPPYSGFHVGRNSTGAIAPNMRFDHCWTSGSFRYAAFFNLASEDCIFQSSRWYNNYPYVAGEVSAAMAIVGSWDLLGSGKAFDGYDSTHHTWGTTGSMSCINHDLGYATIVRPSLYSLSIVGITKSATAVVSLGSGIPAANNIQAGDWVFFQDIEGMTELNGETAEVLSVNSGVGTITVDFNTSTFGTFTSGTLRNRTDCALFLADCKNVDFPGSYMLAYGTHHVKADLVYGQVSGVSLTFQNEALPDRVIQFSVDGDTSIYDWNINLRASSNVVKSSVFNTSGTGIVTIDRLNLHFSGGGASAVMENGIFFQRTNFKVYGARLDVSKRADATTGTLPDDFEGEVFAYDDEQVVRWGGVRFPATALLSTNANTLDDYEEGTWTPALKFGGASVSMTYSTQTGRYVKVGGLVTLWWNITLTNKGSSTGSATITGLPFAVLAAEGQGGAITHYSGMSSSAGILAAANTSEEIVLRIVGATTAAAADNTNFSNSSLLNGFITYQTNE